jgi:adhesin transport system membrane fusion protein
VIVETEKSSLGPNGTLPITPGMVAMVDIHTGRRSVLRYLVTPVLKLRAEAFRER